MAAAVNGTCYKGAVWLSLQPGKIQIFFFSPFPFMVSLLRLLIANVSQKHQ